MSDEEKVMNVFRNEFLYYKSAMDLMNVKLQVLSEEFRMKGDRSPIDHIQSRLKSPETIAEKLRRHQVEVSSENIGSYVRDIAGIRIICPFLEDVDTVANMILRQEGVHLLQCKDYIRNPKPNGYRSLHLIVLVDVDFSDEKKSIPVEIQLRTIAMNCWAALEHQVRYKKTRTLSPTASALLLECAELTASLDYKGKSLAMERNPE